MGSEDFGIMGEDYDIAEYSLEDLYSLLDQDWLNFHEEIEVREEIEYRLREEDRGLGW